MIKMHALTSLILITLAYAAQGAPYLGDSHIVGGRDAEIGEYPYQVSLRRNNVHFCGGSICDRHNIVTAAHCLRGKDNIINEITVHVGTIFLNSTGDTYRPEKFVPNRAHNPSQFLNDIALIHLKTPIKYNKLVQPIRLETNDTGIGNKTCKLTGWGRLSLGGKIPNNLQEIDLIILPHETCKAKQPIVKASHVCTLTKVGEGACHGDSGGPLVVNGSQVGIVSFGVPCAKGYPDVYSRVTSFTSWINQNLKK